MTRINQWIAFSTLVVTLIALPEPGIRAQGLPEVLVEVRFEGNNYNTAPDIDIDRLANNLTLVTSEILLQVAEFGFISFRPVNAGDSLDRLQIAEFLFSEEETSQNSHRHWLSMLWRPAGNRGGAVTVFKELIFGGIDEHHRDDEAELHEILSGRLEKILTTERFTERMMNNSFAEIILAESFAPGVTNHVHIPISQSLLHASVDSRFRAWFFDTADSTGTKRNGFLELKVAFPAAMDPNSAQTLCTAEEFEIPVGATVPEQDRDARWLEMVEILSNEADLRVLVKMQKYIPEGVRGATDDGVIIGDGSP